MPTRKVPNEAATATDDPKTAGSTLVDAVKQAAVNVIDAVAVAEQRVQDDPRSAPPPLPDGRPAANWPALSPYLTVRDAAASMAFYEAAFGFKVEGEEIRDNHGEIIHVGMRLGDACIMFAPQGMTPELRAPVDSGAHAGAAPGVSLYVYVPDVDVLTARAVSAEAELLQAPKTEFWGDRIAMFRDPDGYHWTFATNVAEFDLDKASL